MVAKAVKRPAKAAVKAAKRPVKAAKRPVKVAKRPVKAVKAVKAVKVANARRAALAAKAGALAARAEAILAESKARRATSGRARAKARAKATKAKAERAQLAVSKTERAARSARKISAAKLKTQTSTIASRFENASFAINRDGTADIDVDVTREMISSSWFDIVNTIAAIPYRHWWYRFRIMVAPKRENGFEMVYKPATDPVKGLSQGKANAWRRTRKAGTYGPSARLFIRRLKKRYTIIKIVLEISKSLTQKQPDRR